MEEIVIRIIFPDWIPVIFKGLGLLLYVAMVFWIKIFPEIKEESWFRMRERFDKL